MAMDMPVFPCQRDIGLIVSHPVEVPNPVVGDPRQKALVLFGGCGNPAFEMQALAAMGDWLFLIPDADADAPDNVQSIHFDANLSGVDLMGFVDVVVCKPGYGVLSECWVSGTPLAWVERPDFPEFPMLKEWLDNAMPSAGMSRSDFQQGEWKQVLEKAVNHSGSFPVLHRNGVMEAANIILSSLPL